MPKQSQRIRLLHLLRTYSYEEGIKRLCLHLSINYEDLPGRSRAEKILELVLACERQQRLSELERIARKIQLIPAPRWERLLRSCLWYSGKYGIVIVLILTGIIAITWFSGKLLSDISYIFPVHTTVPRSTRLIPSPVPPVEDQVVVVIKRFNTDQTKAVQSLDLDMLRATATGNWLEFQRQYIDALRQANLYEVQVQRDFRTLAVSVAGSTATVETQETWDTRKYDRTTGECRFHQPEFTVKQTYTLTRTGSIWKIVKVVFSSPAPDDIPGC